MTLLGQREVRPWSPHAAQPGGLDSGLNHLLQRTFWKQQKTSECGLGKDDTSRDVGTVGQERVREGPGEWGKESQDRAKGAWREGSGRWEQG